MVKTPVKVIIRSRPTADFAYKNIQIDENTGHVSINIPKQVDQGFINHQQENWGFTFDKVLQNASQDIVFDGCAKEIVQNVMEGYSGTIMAYGQTGAGKTFTMTGSTVDYKYRGLIPRCISLLFQEKESRYEQDITIGVSYLEIYNEMMYDLLASSQTPDAHNNLAVQEDVNGRVNVKGLMIKKCLTEEEAIAMIFEGETNRTISEHHLNKASSRSHCVFTVHLESRSRLESSERVIVSKLHLVDLAGSERTKKTGSEGKTLIEAQFINKSLSFLEQVVVALSEKQRDHIPYRQSKLTNLLKDSIGGNNKTFMIANIWPEANHLEETISTLKFASRMMKVSNEATIQVNLDSGVLIKKYEKEIRDLRQELAMHDTLANRGRISYEPYAPEQQYEQQKIAQSFLNGEIEDIEFDSLRQVKELFFQFRNLYRNLLKDVENKNFIDTKKQASQVVGQKKSDTGIKQEPVGQEDNNFGFGLGKARKDAKPTFNIENLVNIPKDEYKSPEDSNRLDAKVKTEQGDRTPGPIIDKKIVNVDKQKAFQEYNDKEGKALNDQIFQQIQDLKKRKDDIKEIQDFCNRNREEIEKRKIILQMKQDSKNQEEIAQGIIDEEEFNILKELKDMKKKQKMEQETIRDYKSQIIMMDQSINSTKQQLLSKFENHFLKKYGLALQDLNNPLVNQKEQDYSIGDEESNDIDQDAVAYIRAKNKVNQLQKARKQEKQRS